MSGREIITLQLGNYANYVGTHWWNIQESSFTYDPNAPPGDINHDTLFREGCTAGGAVTYTPRLLLCDLKGALRHLPRSGGDLYGRPAGGDRAAPDSLCWDTDGRLEVLCDEPEPKSQYQHELDGTSEKPVAMVEQPEVEGNNDIGDADGMEATGPSDDQHPNSLSATVRTWTDYMYSRYHPRTINIVDSHRHSSDEAALDTYAAGAALWQTDQFAEGDFADRMRQYLEECNSCQGFQLLFDGDDGFAGLTGQLVQHVRDEYGKTVLAVPVFDVRQRRFPLADAQLTDSIRVCNIALGYAALLADRDSGVDLLLPLSTRSHVWRTASGRRNLPLFDYDANSAYESAAVLATYLDTMTLPYRRKADASSLASFCGSLTDGGRRMAAAGIALPFRCAADGQLITDLDGLDVDDVMVTLTPGCRRLGTERVTQLVSARGMRTDRLKRPLDRAGDQIRMAAYGCNTPAEMLQLYFQCGQYSSRTNVVTTEAGMPVRRPFPAELFDERLRTPHGWWQEWPGVLEAPAEVPVMACAQTGAGLSVALETLHREASRVKMSRVPRFAAAGMEASEMGEALERLLEFSDNYDEALQL